MNSQFDFLHQKLANLTTEKALQFIAAEFGIDAVFSTSFGIEDQVVTDLIAMQKLNISFFTLDTGRLFKETYSTWEATLLKYNITIQTYYPDADALQKFVTTNGPNSFYDSIENRKQCCAIRKVAPLQKALQGKKIWITGIRAAQSPDRKMEQKLEWDATNNIIKYHPIIDWSYEQLQQYVKQNNVPTNILHQQGLVSIGCAPCTRAIKEGEDFRAGRWWWEDTTKKECGLHSN
jgi:phosphoadenosine phosphosulfate reductase